MNILDKQGVYARLDELGRLKEGWLDGEGMAPCQTGLAWLASVFGDAYPDDLPLPCLYPTVEGEVQAEWSLPPYEVSLEIDLRRHTGEWNALNLETDDDDSEQLALDDVDDRTTLFAKIRSQCIPEDALPWDAPNL